MTLRYTFPGCQPMTDLELDNELIECASKVLTMENLDERYDMFQLIRKIRFDFLHGKKIKEKTE